MAEEKELSDQELQILSACQGLLEAARILIAPMFSGGPLELQRAYNGICGVEYSLSTLLPDPVEEGEA
jgi:hypothetical protein